MLTMGVTGKLLTDYVGDGMLTYYGVRFTYQVWPGDTLTATATVTAIREEDGVDARRPRRSAPRTRTASRSSRAPPPPASSPDRRRVSAIWAGIDSGRGRPDPGHESVTGSLDRNPTFSVGFRWRSVAAP